MLTYTSSRNLIGNLTGDSSSANLTVMDVLLNENIRDIITQKPWGFREKTRTMSTVASQQFYNLPADCNKVVNATVTIGSYTYSPKRIKSRQEWDVLNQSSTSTSDIPQYYFVFGKTLGFYPIPSSATTNAITYSYLRDHKDLSVADYTIGTIVSIASGATTVTGSGTSWTSQMTGRYIRITHSDTANTGDGEWYEISSVTSATVLVLVSPYNGTSISAGSAAYTIGQTSMIPENFQMLPIHRTVEMYFTSIQPEQDRAMKFKELYMEGLRRLQAEAGSMAI